MSKESFDEYESEYNSIKKINKVEHIEIVGQDLVINTDVIYCEDPRDNRIHELGKFKIYIPLDNTNANSVRWLNQTRKVKAYEDRPCHAPHVFRPEGTACLGTLAEPMAHALGKKDFYSAVVLAINFIKVTNVDDPAGSKISLWPLAPESIKNVNDSLTTKSSVVYLEEEPATAPTATAPLPQDFVDTLTATPATRTTTEYEW